MALPFHMVGCSYETADITTIGRLAIAGDHLTALVQQLREEDIPRDMPCVMLSTCNRTELYWWGAADGSSAFRAWVAGRVGATLPLGTFERRDGEDAVRHLFSVAAGLRSQRVGEPEVLGQTRGAWLLARDAGATNPHLDSVFQRGIQAARRIRARAHAFEWGRPLGEAAAAFIGTQSCGAEGTEAEAQVPSRWTDRRVLIVGTGAAAESAAAAIVARKPASLRIASRTDDRARAMAEAVGAIPVQWSEHISVLADADVVIFATRSKAPVLRAADAATVMKLRTGARTVWLDLGVPRNVEAHRPPDGLSLYVLSDIPGETAGVGEGAAMAESALQDELKRYAVELARRASVGRSYLGEAIHA